MPFNCEQCNKVYQSSGGLKRHIKTKHPIILLEPDVLHPNFIEVCAGGGGLSNGLIQAGFHPVLLNDNNKDACDTLIHNHPNCNIVLDSMCNLNLTKYRGSIDVLCGGVPCQSYSQAGARRGLEDPRGNLMLRFRDLLLQAEPKIFMIENVKGLTTHNNGATLRQILEHLNVDGTYNITYSILNSVNFGVPQKRERIFIIGIRNTHLNHFIFPLPDENILTVGNVLQNVPESPGAVYSAEKIRLYGMVPQGGCWINLPLEEQRAYLGTSFNSGGGKRGILYRLALDRPSLTLLCTPSQKQTERCHPTEIRPLTIREYARIQTFADDYEFSGSMSSQYKQIGNAVPVELARRVGLKLLECLNGNVN